MSDKLVSIDRVRELAKEKGMDLPENDGDVKVYGLALVSVPSSDGEGCQTMLVCEADPHVEVNPTNVPDSEDDARQTLHSIFKENPSAIVGSIMAHHGRQMLGDLEQTSLDMQASNGGSDVPEIH